MKFLLIFVCWMGQLYLMERVGAQEIDQLVMPGELIQGHAKYEQECEKCHLGFSKETQAKLCLDCHDKVQGDIKQGKGYHGLEPEIEKTPCKDCHTDHIGRDASIVILNPQAFDHKLTDFPLNGAHGEVICGGCHQKDSLFREASIYCIDCHKKDDVHNGELGKKCVDCHNEKRWSKTDFNHDDTDFPLLAAHKEVACESCHADEKYQDTPQDCHSCHQLNDIHGGRRGKKRADCHGQSRWEKIDFNHNSQTDYPLLGKHKRVACDSCHKNDLYEDLSHSCISCHRNDDVHLGRYGSKCNECHSEKDWKKSSFDHNRDTDYKLIGKHIETRCESCHKGNSKEEDLETDCYSCHRKDDVHKGVEGEQCEKCHLETGWTADIGFDHDMSAFPLLGLHGLVPCEECHFDRVYTNAPTGCDDCHRDDDDHKGRLGLNCESCHNANSWAIWLFDHDKQTDYVLDGKHKGLACVACHTKQVNNYHDLKLPVMCIKCHLSDDVHNRQFGRDCGRCHVTEDFKKIQGRRGGYLRK